MRERHRCISMEVYVISSVLIFLFFAPYVQTSSVSLKNLSLTRIPQNISLDVTILHLQLNNILDLPDCCFCKYPQLKHLNLSGNGLQTVSELAFANNSHLFRLELANNRLVSFPSFLQGAGESLTTIKLRVEDDAPITLTSLSFISYPKLKRIDLLNNRISSGTLHLYNLSSLTKLLGKNSGLVVFPNLAAVPQLEYVHLTSCKFTSTLVPHQSLHGLTKLAFLSLSNTGITQLPSMQHLKSLEMIHLHKNKLSTLPDLYNLPLKDVALINNPYRCNKSLCWLRMWCFIKPPPTGFADPLLQCDLPEALRGKALLTVHPVDMECYNDDRFSHLFTWKFTKADPHFTRTYSLVNELPLSIHEGRSRSRLECANRCRRRNDCDHFRYEESVKDKNCILLGQDQGRVGGCPH